MSAATGLRLLTFFFADEAALGERFVQHGLPAPEFADLRRAVRSALVTDPDGQQVELVIVPGATAEQLARIEVGLTVADIERSRAFYRSFVGLEELPPVDDERFGTRKYSYRHGATTISLRSFGKSLPADTGSGGIQYVVSDVEFVDALAKERQVTIDQPLQGLRGFDLRTIWLDDPDGVTNYFAETGASRTARAPAERTPSKKKRRALASSPRWNEAARRRDRCVLRAQTPIAVLMAAFCFVTNCSKLCSAGFSLRAVSTLRFASISLSKSR